MRCFVFLGPANIMPEWIFFFSDSQLLAKIKEKGFGFEVKEKYGTLYSASVCRKHVHRQEAIYIYRCTSRSTYDISTSQCHDNDTRSVVTKL